MKSASAKAKGRRLQQKVRDRITAIFRLQSGDVESRSSGATGTDLLLSPAARRVFPFAVECKNVERLNLWSAWAQANANTTEGLMPLLVVSRNRCVTELAVLELEQLLAILARREKEGE